MGHQTQWLNSEGRLQLRAVSAVAATIRAKVYTRRPGRVEVDENGNSFVTPSKVTEHEFPSQALTGDLSLEAPADLQPRIFPPAEVVGGWVHTDTAARRGQIWVQIAHLDGPSRVPVMAGYVYSERNLGLEFQDPGPRGGSGAIQKTALADDVTPVDIEHTLGVTNTLRKITGFIWYYHCSGDVATRTLRASARDLGAGLPTGYTSGANSLAQVWPSAGVLTLTANEEGMIVVNDQFAVSQDNGTPTFEDPSSRPNPFPYWAHDDDVGEFFFDVEVAQAADRHSIYMIEERWIVV